MSERLPRGILEAYLDTDCVEFPIGSDLDVRLSEECELNALKVRRWSTEDERGIFRLSIEGKTYFSCPLWALYERTPVGNILIGPDVRCTFHFDGAGTGLSVLMFLSKTREVAS